MRVTCRIKKADFSGVSAKAAIAKKRATVAMTDAARMDTLPYVPWVSGDLARTADTESKPERGLLIYGNFGVPYARAQYYAMPNKTTDGHPQAAMQWFEKAKAAKKVSWRRIGAAEYSKLF